MTPLQLFVLAVIFIPLGFALTNRLRADVAALLIAAVLATAQFLGFAVLGAPDSPDQTSRALNGLSQPVVMTLFALFIVSRALEEVGVTRWIANRLLALGGTSEARLIILLTTATGMLSLLMNNLAAGALLLPSAIEVAHRTGISPSKLLIPVSFGSLLGGIATYFTTANIIVSDLLTVASPPQAALGVLDFTPVGGLMALAGIAYMAVIGRRLLPNHRGDAPQAAPTIDREAAYGLQARFWELTLSPESPFEESTIEALGLSKDEIICVWQRRQTLNVIEDGLIIRAGAVILFHVTAGRAGELAAQSSGSIVEVPVEALPARGLVLVEALPAPHMGAEGKTLKGLEFRAQTGYVPLAVLREGKGITDTPNQTPLRLGDAVLLVGPFNQLRRLDRRPDFLLLRQVNQQGITSPRRAAFTIGITAAAVVISVLGVPVYLAMLGAALAVILLGVLKMDDAYNTMEWNALFLIAGMYTASQAMVNTGAAAVIGQQVVQWVEPFGGLGLVAGAYLLSALLTQVMGGQVTAFVTGPITISAAIALNVSPQAVAIATAMGCSASFITPISHPVNLLVMGPGGYTMRDFAKVGVGLLVVCFVVLLIGMRLFWGL